MRLVYILKGKYLGKYGIKLGIVEDEQSRILLATGEEITVSIYFFKKVKNSIRKYGDCRESWEEEIKHLKFLIRTNCREWVKIDSGADYIAWHNLGLTEKYKPLDKRIDELLKENERLNELITYHHFWIDQQNQENQLQEIWTYYAAHIKEEQFAKPLNPKHAVGVQQNLF